MKKLMMSLLLIAFYSCTQDVAEIEPIKVVNVTVNNSSINKVFTSQDLELFNYNLRYASILAGSVILRNTAARDQILNLSRINNSVIRLADLLENNNSAFAIAFEVAFISNIGRPGGEDGTIGDLIGVPRGMADATVVATEYKNKSYSHQRYLNFLSDIEFHCLEFYFPVDLNFNENDIRITVTTHPLFSEENQNNGIEFYQELDNYGTLIRASKEVVVDEDYVRKSMHTNDNVLVLRPFREAPNCILKIPQKIGQ